MRRLNVGFVLLLLLQLGSSAPQNNVKSKDSPLTPSSSKSKTSHSTPQTLSSMATPQALGDGIVQLFGGHKTGKELMLEKAAKTAQKTVASPAPKGPVKPMRTTPGNIPRSSAVAKPLGRSPNAPRVPVSYVPPPPKPRVSVPQIRQEIQQILELNKKIKSMQSGRSVQLQRIQEQARIHQKILNELEMSQKKMPPGKTVSKSELLAQEKLRIIHEETQRNAHALTDPKEMPAKAVGKPAENLKTVAS